MSEPNEEEESRQLADLFDRTARAPSEIERARLVEHAASVAGSKRHATIRARFVWPLALAAAAAIAYLVLAPERARAPVATTPPSAPQPKIARAQPRIAPAPSVRAPNDFDEDDPVAEIFGGDTSELSPDLSPLFPMSDEDRREAALQAAEDAKSDLP